MKTPLLTATVFVLCFSGFGQSLPSSGISASAGSADNGTSYVSWTMGEPFVGTFSSGTGSLTHELFANPKYPVTGIEYPETTRLAKVYPNPSIDRLWVELPLASESYYLQIFSTLGGEVTSLTVSGSSDKTIDTSTLPSGVYIMKLIRLRNNTVETFKIIIEK